MENEHVYKKENEKWRAQWRELTTVVDSMINEENEKI